MVFLKYFACSWSLSQSCKWCFQNMVYSVDDSIP